MSVVQDSLFTSSASIRRRRKLRNSYLSDGIVFECSLLGSLHDSKMIDFDVQSKEKLKENLTAKEYATKNNDPYISIVSVKLDENDINNGAFELDWNDKFIINLVKNGYQYDAKDTEDQIVDRWFQTVCKNIANEIYEQNQADLGSRKPE